MRFNKRNAIADGDHNEVGVRRVRSTASDEGNRIEVGWWLENGQSLVGGDPRWHNAMVRKLLNSG